MREAYNKYSSMSQNSRNLACSADSYLITAHSSIFPIKVEPPTKENCRKFVSKMRTIQAFEAFASLAKEWNAEDFNNCLHSTSGLKDVQKLHEITKLASEVHSVVRWNLLIN